MLTVIKLLILLVHFFVALHTILFILEAIYRQLLFFESDMLDKKLCNIFY